MTATIDGSEGDRAGRADSGSAGARPGAGTSGPLRVCPQNPRYFADATGRAVYLTGAHTWNNLQNSEVYPGVDYPAYLDFLTGHNHNYMRMWAFEQAAWDPWTVRQVSVSPVPYERTGPGDALDGKPKFDLARFNQGYFDLLRSRVSAARDRGIYVSVMLFEGWSVERKGQVGNPWPGHPFNKANNVNGIDGDPGETGEGKLIHTLEAGPETTTVQQKYVRKAIDTLNDLDNVLWEIGNEMHPGTVEWQYRMIEFIHDCEKEGPSQHPVGMTGAPIENEPLFNGPADWISPTGRDGYSGEPPASGGEKVIIADVDHIWPRDFQKWVWKSFLRGLNTAFMDPYGLTVIGDPSEWLGELIPRWTAAAEGVRKNMGYTLSFARRMDLNAAVPRGELASTGYCLANPGEQYLVYLPEGGTVTVDLSEAAGKLAVEWLNPRSGEKSAGEGVDGGSTNFEAPFDGDAVLYVSKVSVR